MDVLTGQRHPKATISPDVKLPFVLYFETLAKEMSVCADDAAMAKALIRSLGLDPKEQDPNMKSTGFSFQTCSRELLLHAASAARQKLDVITFHLDRSRRKKIPT